MVLSSILIVGWYLRLLLLELEAWSGEIYVVIFCGTIPWRWSRYSLDRAEEIGIVSIVRRNKSFQKSKRLLKKNLNASRPSEHPT